MSNTYARCPMEKSKGHWTFRLSNGSLIVHWTLACPLDPMDFPSDICFFIWSITMYLNDVMTSIWTSCRYSAIEIAKRKCPLDPMDLEISIGILFVHWIQWTSGISIGHLLFSWSINMYLNDVMTRICTSCRY